MPGTLGSRKASRFDPSPFLRSQNLLPEENKETALLEVRRVTNYPRWPRTYLYVTLLVDKKVLRLQISVDEIQRVKVFKGQYNLGCIKAGVWFTTNKTVTQHIILNITMITMKRNKTHTMSSYLNLPILLKCENISPPGTYSITIYRLLLSCRDR